MGLENVALDEGNRTDFGSSVRGGIAWGLCR